MSAATRTIKLGMSDLISVQAIPGLSPSILLRNSWEQFLSCPERCLFTEYLPQIRTPALSLLSCLKQRWLMYDDAWYDCGSSLWCGRGKVGPADPTIWGAQSCLKQCSYARWRVMKPMDHLGDCGTWWYPLLMACGTVVCSNYKVQLPKQDFANQKLQNSNLST